MRLTTSESGEPSNLREERLSIHAEAYHVDHGAAVEEISALAALLAGVIQATHRRAFFLDRLSAIAEEAREHESVQQQLRRAGKRKRLR